jgi:hypothetical protein
MSGLFCLAITKDDIQQLSSNHGNQKEKAC